MDNPKIILVKKILLSLPERKRAEQKKIIAEQLEKRLAPQIANFEKDSNGLYSIKVIVSENGILTIIFTPEF